MQFTAAINEADKIFRFHGYSGVGEVFEAPTGWIFDPNINHVEYGALQVYISKNNGKPRAFNPNVEEDYEILKNAKKISV